MPEDLHELDRREIFAKIVQIQDEGADLDETRSRVTAEFSIDTELVREIESEGIKKKWPPL